LTCVNDNGNNCIAGIVDTGQQFFVQLTTLLSLQSKNWIKTKLYVFSETQLYPLQVKKKPISIISNFFAGVVDTVNHL